MRKASAVQETDSNQPGLFDGLGRANAEDPQAKNGSTTVTPRTNPGIADENANPQTERPMPAAGPSQPTENPTGADAGGTQAAVDSVESEAPRETPPIGEPTHSSMQTGTDGPAAIPGAASDHPDAPEAAVNGYAPHASDQRGRVPVTEATGSRTDAPREPEEADRSAIEAQNGEPPNNDQEESGGVDESGRTGALVEDGAIEASLGATDPTISPEPAAVATAADSPEGSGTNQPAGPGQPGTAPTAPSNGTTIRPGAGSKKGSPHKERIKRRHIKVHPDVEVIRRQAGLYDIWHEIWQRQTNTKTALLKRAGVEALLATTELRVIKKQDEYLCYSNTWMFRHLERILAPDEKIAVEVHANVSREQLRQEVLNEYLLRPVYYRVPKDPSFGVRLLASMQTPAVSELFGEVTLRPFENWTGFKKGSISTARKKK